MSIGKAFAPYNIALGSLPETVLENITEVIFSYRDGVETVCAVTPSLEALEAMVGTVPDLIKSVSTSRYFVDLESIGTDKLRLYISSSNANVSIEGYYFDKEGKPFVKKVYKKKGKKGLLIDYYDAEGNIIEADSPEVTASRSSWLGNPEVADAADSSDYHVLYLKKVTKPQCYIRIY
jgi:hypothetical protein